MAVQPVVKKNVAGAVAKRRNHIVPRFLLERWAQGQSLFHMDADDGTIHQERQTTKHGRKRSEARFAIQEFLYVPIRFQDGTPYRDEELENRFACVEDALKKWEPGPKSQTNAARFVDGMLTCTIDLGFRSAYEYEKLACLLEKLHPGKTPDEYARAAVDHFQNVYTLKQSQFCNWDYRYVHGFTEELLICDRPAFDTTVRPSGPQAIFMPLGPHALIVGQAPKDPHRLAPRLEVFETESLKSADNLNRMTVERARRFLVASPATLERYRHTCTPAHYQARVAKDSFVFERSSSAATAQRNRTRAGAGSDRADSPGEKS